MIRLNKLHPEDVYWANYRHLLEGSYWGKSSEFAGRRLSIPLSVSAIIFCLSMRINMTTCNILFFQPELEEV